MARPATVWELRKILSKYSSDLPVVFEYDGNFRIVDMEADEQIAEVRQGSANPPKYYLALDVTLPGPSRTKEDKLLSSRFDRLFTKEEQAKILELERHARALFGDRRTNYGHKNHRKGA